MAIGGVVSIRACLVGDGVRLEVGAKKEVDGCPKARCLMNLVVLKTQFRQSKKTV